MLSCTDKPSALTAALALAGCAGFAGNCGQACAGDAQLRDQVQARIYEQPSLRSLNIHVQTYQHAVYLVGLVDTRADRRRAVAIARAVPGVSTVYNELALDGNGI